MARLNEDELKKQIKSGTFDNVYFIYGEESYLKEFYVNKLKSKIVDPAFADFNYHCYENKNTPLDVILNDADTLPVMSEYTFILVHDYPLDKSESELELLKAYFNDISQSCVIVFWCDNIDVDVKKNAKWRKIENAFAKFGASVDMQKRTESDLAKLIVSRAKKKNCLLSLNDARYLIRTVGSDIKTVFNETDKICAFVSQGEITKQNIDLLAVKSLQARVFDLSKSILKGDCDGAFEILNGLFAQKEEPIAILAVIASCYTDMYRVKCAKAANQAQNDVGNYYNYKNKEFLLTNASRNCKDISFENLRKSIDVLAKTDELLKSTSVNKNILLEETVAKLLMLRGA